MLIDSVADLLTRIRNAQRAHHRSVTVRSSRLGREVLEVMKREGFIESYSKIQKQKDKATKELDAGEKLEVVLRYYESGEPLMSILRRASTSGQRRYVRADKLPRVSGGLGISIISTSSGVLSDREARKQGIGGEILALIG